MRAIVGDPFEPSVIYAGLASKGIYRSPDSGQTWQTRQNGIPQEGGVFQGACSLVRAFYASPTNPGRLYAALQPPSSAAVPEVEPVDAGDTVTDGQHRTDFRDLGLGAEAGDLVLDDLRDFSGADIHVQPFIEAVLSGPQPFIAWARELRRVRIEPST